MFSEQLIGRLTFAWMSIISLSFLFNNLNFKYGPHKNLYILGICIDTYKKYFIAASFCFINSGIRVLQKNILHPWIINTVQNNNHTEIEFYKSYEISLIYSVYEWFDFFMYMNILLSQIDMFLIEVLADTIVTIITTMYYIKNKELKNNIKYSAIGSTLAGACEGPQQISGEFVLEDP